MVFKVEEKSNGVCVLNWQMKEFGLRGTEQHQIFHVSSEIFKMLQVRRSLPHYESCISSTVCLTYRGLRIALTTTSFDFYPSDLATTP